VPPETVRVERSSEADRSKRGSAENRTLAETVSESPLTSAGIAAGVGFLLGGGLRTRAGMALLLFVGRIVAREMTVNYLAGAVSERR